VIGSKLLSKDKARTDSGQRGEATIIVVLTTLKARFANGPGQSDRAIKSDYSNVVRCLGAQRKPIGPSPSRNPSRK
jgi:hypothetical protein